VPVVRRIRAKSATAVARLIIHHPQLGNLSLLQAWTTAVDQPAALSSAQVQPLPLAADRQILLTLAKLVQTIQSHQLEEESDAYPTAANQQQPVLGESDRRPTAATDQPSGPATPPVRGRLSGDPPADNKGDNDKGDTP
jgi:hypothetical protein